MNKPISRNGPLNGPEHEPVVLGAADFFARADAKLGFDVPLGLYDPNIVPTSGDPGTDKMLEIVAREQPVRPAAVML